MRSIFTTIFILFSLAMFSQKTEETAPAADSTLQSTDPIEIHSPRKATIMSAIVPGLGQAYNKKYWKIPVVYAGIGVAVYFIQDNTKNYKYFKEQLIFELDDNPNTLNTSGYTSTKLDEIQNTYRRWLDISYMSLAGVYILNIIDANVDGHLFHFDVDENLSLNLRPTFNPAFNANTGISLSLNF